MPWRASNTAPRTGRLTPGLTQLRTIKVISFRERFWGGRDRIPSPLQRWTRVADSLVRRGWCSGTPKLCTLLVETDQIHELKITEHADTRAHTVVYAHRALFQQPGSRSGAATHGTGGLRRIRGGSASTGRCGEDCCSDKLAACAFYGASSRRLTSDGLLIQPESGHQAGSLD